MKWLIILPLLMRDNSVLYDDISFIEQESIVSFWQSWCVRSGVQRWNVKLGEINEVLNNEISPEHKINPLSWTKVPRKILLFKYNELEILTFINGISLFCNNSVFTKVRVEFRIINNSLPYSSLELIKVHSNSLFLPGYNINYFISMFEKIKAL